MRTLLCTTLLTLTLGSVTCRAEDVARIPANVVVELPFTAAADYNDPFNEVTLDVVFTDPNGAELRVPAFWSGGKNWKVRYASPVVGTHRYRSECSKTGDAGLHGITGEVAVKPYMGDNPLYKHGPIRIAADHRHFEHADGTPFLWLGDTWWMGLCHRLHWPDEVKQLAADRKAKGFNVIQIVAGLYPDMPAFDPRGANEAGFPWEPDYARIRPEYWDAADQRLLYLVEQGFTPCIVGAWGYFIPWMGVEKANQHWRNLIARYGAMPVVWCAAGEANLPYYLAKGFPYDDRKQVTEWTKVMRYIRETDPFRRPLTIHPTGIGRLSARHATDDATLLDFDMLQTPHGQRNAVEPTVHTMRESYADSPTMPVINGEAAYEMLGDSLPTQWTRQMFWLCMTSGAAGHTYGANGIWQCNRPGEPHGPSPWHPAGSTGYGRIPWNEAMNLPGSTHVGLGKKLFDRYAWQEFKPQADWAEYAPASGASSPKWGDWIWFPEADPTKDAPAAKRYFRKTFQFDESAIDRATLWLAVDDKYVAYVNGEKVGAQADWQSPQAVDITNHLRAGKNVLAIEAENLPAPGANPAGLSASVLIVSADGRVQEIKSDDTWRCSKDLEAADSDWTSPDFDDSNWPAAKKLADFGQQPWGNLQTGGTYGPFATGSEKVRIIYVPERHAVRTRQLDPAAKYRAYTFDVTTGKTTEPVEVAPDADGAWTAPLPANDSDAPDWVLVVERDE